MRVLLSAALLLTALPCVASDPVASYMTAVKSDVAVWEISRKPVNPAHAQGLYETAMAGAANNAQRQALAVHWGKAQACFQKRLPIGDSDAVVALQERCKEELSERAAKVEAAKYAPD